MNSMKETMTKDVQFNVSVTENGALGYRTTGKELLDLNFRVASFRRAQPKQIIDSFMKAFYENKELAMKWLFYARDAREGLGERRLFRVVVNYLCNNNPEVMNTLIQFIPEYGRWDDMLVILETEHAYLAVGLIKGQLQKDVKGMQANQPISLLAKWLPSVNTSSRETVKFARLLRTKMGMNEKTYRQTLSALRKHLNIVEASMSAKQWSEINYEAVPSRANLIYNGAFLRNDEDRRRAYLGALAKGEAKINASVLYPHDIVHKYTDMSGYTRAIRGTDETLEALWKNLPDVVNGCGNTIVVADGSGSMTQRIGNTNMDALAVANALAIYFSERSSGQFKDQYITFSERPQLVDFSGCSTLREKIDVAHRHNEIASTNIEAVFDLILKTAIAKGMEQSELPGSILIISDCEFNQNTTRNSQDKRLFEVFAEKFAEHGYLLPRLVFWNVNSRTNTIPVIESPLGVALVSGFSVNIVKMVLSGETCPYKCLVEQLMSERYAPITVAA